MSGTDRPATPPQSPQNAASRVPGVLPRSPQTPEKVRKIEESRLRAKAKREQYLAAQARNGTVLETTPNGFPVTRRSAKLSAPGPETVRNASTTGLQDEKGSGSGSASAAASKNGKDGGGFSGAETSIRPAKKFDKYIEYDFARMTDTKGGFLSADDDMNNRAMMHRQVAALGEPRGGDGGGGAADDRPAYMTEREWERLRLLRQLRATRAGPFEPGVSAADAAEKKREGKGAEVKQCRECESLDIDWRWEDVFGVCVCGSCRDKMPEKYSLLTKTEVKEDYLLTEPELKDTSLLPHLSRPNPYKSTYSHMQLYLRIQVEEYAFSSARWGSAENLDAEHERRETERKKRKEKKFAARLGDLRKRTRVEAWKRRTEKAKMRKKGGTAGGGASRGGGGFVGGDGDEDEGEEEEYDEDGDRIAQFGDAVGRQEKHVHEWGRAIEDPETGVGTKRCVGCGMEVEEMEF